MRFGKDFLLGKDAVSPLTKRPALCAFAAVATLFVVASYPTYALVLVPIAVIVALNCSRQVLAACAVCLALALVSLCFEFRAQATYELRKAESPPSESSGVVESLIPRKSGTAVILKTDYGLLRLSHKDSATAPPMPGDSVRFTASYYPAEAPTVPGAFDTPAWLKSQKLLAYGKLETFEILKTGRGPGRYFYRFREWLRSRISPWCSAGETGLLLGLLAGDRSGIPDALQNDFRRTGLVHVLAISGFHVVLLSGILMLILKGVGLPHNAARIIAIILLLLYIPVTGGSPAVTRAVLMFTIVEASAVFQRDSDSLNSLGAALLIIALPQPHEIWNPGFQLSAAATAGIIAGQRSNPFKKISAALSKNLAGKVLSEYVLGACYVTFCATLATAPFLAYHFQSFSPCAWFGNIVVVPCVSLAMYGGVFTVMSPLDFLQENFGRAAGFFLKLAAMITKSLAEFPGSQLTLGPFPVPILLASGALFATFPLLKIRFYRRLALTISLVLSFSLLLYALDFRLNPSFKVTFIDVGQADSILLETPAGKTFLIDAGNGGKRNDAGNKIVPYLRNRGVRELDAIIVTHADADHYGGAEGVFKNFPVRELWVSECARIEEKQEWQDVLYSASQTGVKIRDVNAGFFYRENFLTLSSLHPQAKTCGETNRESVTLMASAFGRRVLLTGDLTKEGEAEILKTKNSTAADILKLGHHGSKTSSSVAFLNEVAPLYTIASSGKNNRYRHPSKEIVARLDSLKIPMLNTAKCGSVYLDINREGMKLSASNGFVKYWRTSQAPREQAAK